MPDLSACGEPVFYRRSKIQKAYWNKFPAGAYFIYPDRKNYVGLHVDEWINDEEHYVYLYQPQEEKAFADFFTTQFQMK